MSKVFENYGKNKQESMKKKVALGALYKDPKIPMSRTNIC
jgi:hypothetical protein